MNQITISVKPYYPFGLGIEKSMTSISYLLFVILLLIYL